jgi:hypothetical protein
MFPRGRVLLALIASALLCACDDAPPAGSTPAGGSSRPAQSKGALPPDMVAAVSASQSSLIISVHFALGGQPAIGKPLPVDIAVVPHRPFASVRAHFDSQDGLQVTEGAVMPEQKDASAEKPLPHRIVVQPLKEGVYMITVGVETQSDEGNITRIYSIPVIVQPPGATPAPATAPAATPPAPAG